MEEKLLLIDEIQVEYQKLFNECKQKHEEVKSGLDEGLKVLEELKESPLEKLDENIETSIDKLINPIILISKNKVKRIYISSLIVLQKIITNSLISKEHSSQIIKSLEEMCLDSSEEFVHQKIIETLSPLININLMEIKEDIIESIIKMCLKFFGIKGSSFKESLTELINQLINIVCANITSELEPVIKEKLENLKNEEINEKTEEDQNNNNNSENNNENKEDNNNINDALEKNINIDEFNNNNVETENENNNNNNEQNVIKEEKGEDGEIDEEAKQKEEKLNQLKEKNYFIEPKINLEGYEESDMFKSLFYIFKIACDLAEGKKIENVYKGVHSKCLGYEILSLLLIKTNNLFIYFPSIMVKINDSLHKELLKRFGKAYDYFTCIKIARLAVKIMANLNVGYDYIPFLIKYAETANIGWQKQVGIESIGELLFCPDFLNDLFLKNLGIYESIFNSLFKISNELIEHCKKKNLVMNLAKNELEFNKIVKDRIIMQEDIFFSFEKEPKLVIVQEVIYVEILQCYVLLFQSFEKICINQNKNFERKNAVQILGFKEQELLHVIINLCQYSVDDEVIDKFMNILVSIIKSLSIINLKEIRNLYLIEIEKLLGYSTNTFKSNSDINMNIGLEEKIMKIVFRMFNEIPEVIDKEGYTLLISCLHKIYLKILKSDYNLLLNTNEEYEINIYIRLFEENLKKYSTIKDLPEILDEDLERKTIKEEKNESDDINNNININTIEEEKENEKEKEEKPAEGGGGGGFFGTFKYVLGFSKKKEVNFEEEAMIEKQKKEMFKKLTDCINKIFLCDSTTFSNDCLINIINALLESSQEIMEQNKDNQVAFLNFNLTKLLEIILVNLNRFDLVWNSFAKITNDITSRQMKKISHFSIDIIVIAIIFILNLNIYNLDNKIDAPQITQDKIFSAMTEISAKNISQDINLNIIYNINFLLNNVTLSFDTNGWNELFKSIHNLILYQDEAQTENCFAIIEKIFEGKLNTLSPENIEIVMEIMESFICYKKNNIISKESLKMLDYLSVLCEKFQPYIYITDFSKSEINLNPIQKDFFINKYNTKEKRINYFDKIWKNIFNKLINLSCDERKEIRELVISEFSKIFAKRCRSISPKSSLEIIKNDFFENFLKIYNIYDEKLKHNRAVIQLKKEQVLKAKREEKAKREFVVGNFIADDLVKEDEEKENNEIEEMIKENDEEKDKKKLEELSWEDTLQVSVKSIAEIIPAFLETNPNLGYEFYRDNIFKLIGDNFTEPMKFISPKVAIEILKAIYLISQGNKLLFYKYFSCFLSIYNEMAIFISSEYFLQAFPKMSVECHMVNEIINNLRLVFCNKEYHPIMNNKNVFNTLFKTIKALIVSALNNEGQTAKKQTESLLKDEESVFNFITEIQDLILKYNYSLNNNKDKKKKEKSNNLKNNNKNKNKINLIDLEEYENELDKEKNINTSQNDNLGEVEVEDILVLFTEFLNSYLIIDINNLHSEALCRKCLDLFVQFYTNELLPISITKKTLPYFITKCRDLILLRQKSELVSTIFITKEEYNQKIKSTKDGNKTFGNNFNNDYSNFIIDEMIESGTSKYQKNRYSNNSDKSFYLIWQYASDKMIKILTYVVVQNNKDRNYDKYNIEEIWTVLIEAYDMIFRQRESVFKNLKKSHKEWVSNSSSEMKISIINFIVNVLLPNSLHIPKEMQIRLLILLDIGSSLEYESRNESSGSVTSSISKVCISNLFELCKFKTPETLKREINDKNFNPDDYVKIKEKIAKMCTPILIKRCKEILKKFLADEIKSGSMPLSRSRLEDIKYVLDKLKKLEIYPEYNKIDEMSGNKEVQYEKEHEIMNFILKKKKSHLISLLPLLSEFITTKENEIKILVKDIFKIISSELGIK